LHSHGNTMPTELCAAAAPITQSLKYHQRSTQVPTPMPTPSAPARAAIAAWSQALAPYTAAGQPCASCTANPCKSTTQCFCQLEGQAAAVAASSTKHVNMEQLCDKAGSRWQHQEKHILVCFGAMRAEGGHSLRSFERCRLLASFMLTYVRTRQGPIVTLSLLFTSWARALELDLHSADVCVRIYAVSNACIQ